jgi:lipid II:glycine glycyltransferase (peptidoglycan interpeptide bridge formation enzyme)
MGKDLRIHVAFKDDIPIASILTLTDKKILVYKYGCSDARFNNLGGTALLFWNAIREARANGFEELDMGRSDTDNTGLVAFKEHWGAERSTLNYWRYPAQTNVLRSRVTMKNVSHVISLAPDRALLVLGNLLYRHIG